MGIHIAKSGFNVPFSANALDITKNIINVNANRNPSVIKIPVPCLDFLEETITPIKIKINNFNKEIHAYSRT